MRDNVRTAAGILPVTSWALYDLANQFFALNIVSLYFPRWLSVEMSVPEIFYSAAFAVSVLCAAVSVPVLGTIADNGNRHRQFLIRLTLISVIFTACLGLSQNVILALLFFCIANFGCQAAVVFYNALLVKVAPPERLGLISGLGRMSGYIGAILALILTKPVILKYGYRATFFITAVMFLIFALPCMIFVREERSRGGGFSDREGIAAVFRRLKATVLDEYRSGELRDILKASFFLLCAVNTVILFMSVYGAKVFDLTEAQMIDLIAFSTLFAVAGSIFSGYICDRIGCGRSLIGVFVLWGLCLIGGGLVEPPFHWVLGALAGLGLGSVWVVFRAFIARLVLPEKIGAAFALFNIVGYLAGIVGPLFWGAAMLCLSQFGARGYRAAFMGLTLFVAAGLILFVRTRRWAPLKPVGEPYPYTEYHISFPHYCLLEFRDGSINGQVYGANGNLLDSFALPKMALTVNGGSGSGIYDYGTDAAVQADGPPFGYYFSHWSGDTAQIADIYDAATTITMLDHAMVTAEFKRLYGCFTAGTPVVMADYTSRAIEDVKVGDRILSYDEKAGEFTQDEVKKAFLFPHEEDHIIINGTVRVTASQPFLRDDIWADAGELSAGDTIMAAEGIGERIYSIERVNGGGLVYNIEVYPRHTFVAGGYVVHNKPMPNTIGTTPQTGAARTH